LDFLIEPHRELAESKSMVDQARDQAVYPTLLTYSQIKHGGLVVYIACKRISTDLSVIFYMFLGISLATHNYVNPAVDIVKKRGIVSSLLLTYLVQR
jgi:hypothetical protein